VEEIGGIPISRQTVEVVERKGLGHPDTIMDSISEAVSVALSKVYIEEFGQVLHHNIDKGLLAAGRAVKDFGGGKILKPMHIYIGDRATFLAGGKKIPVREIAVEAAKGWFSKNLRFVNPERHIKYNVVLAPGSEQLARIYSERETVKKANDTSAGVGFWPLTKTEEAVLAIEKFLNSRPWKTRFPETGEDVKVMGVREGKTLVLTIAMPLIDRFLRGEGDYFSRKDFILEEIGKFLEPYKREFDLIDLHYNSLDERGRGTKGVYLSVLGTSAEDADSGSVGRGNRVNGLITFSRPMSLEAGAGKNPVSHVGKVYNVLAQILARRVYEEVEEIEEAYIYLVSRIGIPLNEPQLASAKLRLKKGVKLPDISAKVKETIEDGLSRKNIQALTRGLWQGKYPVC